MKKIISNLYRKISVVTLLGFFVLIWGCSLDEVVYDQVTPSTFYKTESDFNAALTAVFHSYFGGFTFQAQWMNVGDDEMTSNFNQIGEADNHNIVSTNYSSYEVTWTSLWGSIAAANAILRNLESAEFQDTEKAEIEGQALFGRALAYLFLVRWYGDLPLVDETTTLDEILISKRSPVSDIYDLIVSDLKKAETLLPVRFDDRGRPTQGAAKAILSEAYLHMAGWPLHQTEKYAEARDKALEVIQSGTYKLEEKFADLWTLEGENSQEYIFQLEAIGLSGYANYVIDKLPTEDGGWENYIAELSYYNAFPEGKRKDATFYTVSESGLHFTEWSIGTPTIGKYNARDISSISAPALGQFNTPIIRLAEVMLIYAEAQNLADNGPNETSVQILNDLRERGNDNFVEATVNDFDVTTFDQIILDEKHWELGFEYSRWFDMTRRELLPSNVTKEHYYMPIPSAELTIIDFN